MSEVLTIAIAGASASGKTLLATTIVEELTKECQRQSIAMLREDMYYRDQTQLSASEREQTNYDHPDAFEHSLMLKHLQSLKAGQAVKSPIYDFTIHNRSAQTRRVEPARVVLVEGILVLGDSRLLPEFDIKVFVDTALDICLLRRIQRDVKDRGRSLESVAEQYHATVRPMYFEYIAPSRSQADVVVTNGGMNRVAIDMIKSRIKPLLM